MDELANVSWSERGSAMLELIRELFPLNRSITGKGVRATLRAVSRIAPIVIHEVPTGTAIFDWVVPNEWNVSDAYVAAPDGRRLIDFRQCNLHLVGYSVPVRRRMSLQELLPHLHSDPSRPEVIPYRTSYYTQNWGFGIPHAQLSALDEGEYDVVVDSTLDAGHLTYGEAVVPGNTNEIMLIYTHTCHPSLANDNLSGIAVCAELARWLAARDNHLTYHIVFGPVTIGSLTWLARNLELLPRVKHGLVVALVGNKAPLFYKELRSGLADIDRTAAAYIRNEAPDGVIRPFDAWGYDERQFNSPGFRLPVGRLTRSPEEGYPEYHSSSDNVSLIDADSLMGSLLACQTIIAALDSNRHYVNTSPFGEPQLGKRGIYRSIGGMASSDLQKALLWVLNLSDGEHDLASIYSRSGLQYAALSRAITILVQCGLLRPVDGNA